MQLSSDETKLLITFKFKCDVTVTHNLRLSEPETLIIVPPTDNVNHIAAPSSYYNQLLRMFQPYDEDISWEISKRKAVVRNYDTSKIFACFKQFLQSMLCFRGSRYAESDTDADYFERCRVCNFSNRPRDEHHVCTETIPVGNSVR